MDDAESSELRDLRRRAYGPNADIHRDPEALNRLRQLEGIDQTPEGPDLGEPAETPMVSAPSVPADGEEPARTDGLPSTADVSPRRRWTRRRLAWTWAGSLIAAVLLGAGLTAWGSSIVAPGEPVRVATLRQAALEWPEFLGTATADARGFTEFLGMTAITSERQWGGADTDICVIVLEAADAQMTANDGRTLPLGCGTAAFPATAQFQVTPDMPAELIERFPVGTQLQFVLSEQLAEGIFEIDVFAADS